MAPKRKRVPTGAAQAPAFTKGAVPKRLAQFANSCPQLDSRPSWRFSLADTATDSPWVWGGFDEACAVKIFKLAVEMEKLAWHEIQSQNTGGARGGLRNKAIPVENLSSEAQNRLVALNLDDVDELFRFRLGNLERLWGIRLGDPWVFYPLWWDPNHQVCPSVPR